jgi:hypothetical protein
MAGVVAAISVERADLPVADSRDLDQKREESQTGK